MNQVCRRNSRNANGGLNICTIVSRAEAKKPSTVLIGLAIVSGRIKSGLLSGRWAAAWICESFRQASTNGRPRLGQIISAVDPLYGMRSVTSGTMTARIRFS